MTSPAYSPSYLSQPVQEIGLSMQNEYSTATAAVNHHQLGFHPTPPAHAIYDHPPPSANFLPIYSSPYYMGLQPYFAAPQYIVPTVVRTPPPPTHSFGAASNHMTYSRHVQHQPYFFCSPNVGQRPSNYSNNHVISHKQNGASASYSVYNGRNSNPEYNRHYSYNNNNRGCGTRYAVKFSTKNDKVDRQATNQQKLCTSVKCPESVDSVKCESMHDIESEPVVKVECELADCLKTDSINDAKLDCADCKSIESADCKSIESASSELLNILDRTEPNNLASETIINTLKSEIEGLDDEAQISLEPSNESESIDSSSVQPIVIYKENASESPSVPEDADSATGNSVNQVVENLVGATSSNNKPLYSERVTVYLNKKDSPQSPGCAEYPILSEPYVMNKFTHSCHNTKALAYHQNNSELPSRRGNGDESKLKKRLDLVNGPKPQRKFDCTLSENDIKSTNKVLNDNNYNSNSVDIGLAGQVRLNRIRDVLSKHDNNTDDTEASHITCKVSISPVGSELVKRDGDATSLNLSDVQASNAKAENDVVSKLTKSWASLFDRKKTPSDFDTGKNGAITNCSVKILAVSDRKRDELAHRKIERGEVLSSAKNSCRNMNLVRNRDSDVNPFNAAFVEDDEAAQALGVQLQTYKLFHRGQPYQLRGLVNSGTWCYVNTTLQALMACPPFVHLMRYIRHCLPRRPVSATPILDLFVDFVGEFSDKIVRRGPQDLDIGAPFEPTRICDALKSCSKMASSFKGRQEDAEEFLNLLLNCLQEEVTKCIEFSGRSTGTNNRLNNVDGDVDNEDWQKVGPNKKAVVTRMATMTVSPIASIFSGCLRNTVHMNGKTTANVESFFVLPLDIQPEEVTSVQSALQHMHRELIKTSVKGKGEVTITKRTTFEELPSVFILQLKYFVCNSEGQPKKLNKFIEFGVDLSVDRNMLTLASTVKMDRFKRSYKLFAVIYHHGPNASAGHYTVSTFHGGFWVHLDDSKITPISEDQIFLTRPSVGADSSTERVPYLLFYRRCDNFVEKRNNYGFNYANYSNAADCGNNSHNNGVKNGGYAHSNGS